MTPQKLRDAAARIRETAQAATPGPWTAIGASVGYDAGQCTCYGGTLPQGHEPGCGLDLLGEVSVPDAQHIALWSPPVALAVADWLEDAAGEADMVARIMVPAGTVHDGDSEPWVPRLLPGALVVADLILGGAR